MLCLRAGRWCRRTQGAFAWVVLAAASVWVLLLGPPAALQRGHDGPPERARPWHAPLPQRRPAARASLPPTASAPPGGVSSSVGEANLAARADADAAEKAKAAAAAAEWRPHTQPVALSLQLPQAVEAELSRQARASVMTSFGFNLTLSNSLPLDRALPDYRDEVCKARSWPPPATLPKVSVIIIFYNEPLSTLLRNVLGVLNRSPPALLGEVVLIDDHSMMTEHAVLNEHLDRLASALPPGKVRLVRRDVHDGIVGARLRGAREAVHPIIVFLDSHAEVCEGWLEPLAARIAEERTRVVVPSIVPINVNLLELARGHRWPPSRGSFNWRLAFTIVLADTELDVLERGVPPASSATRTPVMPGGLFAMDRRFFFELGGYDDEIKFYGGEHVELSFRVWGCGGSMEVSPCSVVGHIYREFNRFGQDPQLSGVDIGAVMDRNDARVAEVWLDEYKELFYRYRPSARNVDLGDLAPRRALRERLRCKPFRWFLDSVCRDHYVPDFGNPPFRALASPDGAECVDGGGRHDGAPTAGRCVAGRATQLLSHTSQGYLQFRDHYNHKLTCVRAGAVSQMPCGEGGRWRFAQRGGAASAGDTIESLDRPGRCLERGVHAGDQVKLRACNASSAHQLWAHGAGDDGAGTLSGAAKGTCLDNMQRTRGPPGLYACHGYGTQRWLVTDEGQIRAKGKPTCVGLEASVSLFPCLKDDDDYRWKKRSDDRFESVLVPGRCLTRAGLSGGGGRAKAALALAPCDDANESQRWVFALRRR